ncbi:pentatricopeptide repeat-containing protein-like protein [Xylogone sp. PMI_703]|nr:pentatricopeptide repeat-containing protein-like protein [Xylogone sp. PMI_703]
MSIFCISPSSTRASLATKIASKELLGVLYPHDNVQKRYNKALCGSSRHLFQRKQLSTVTLEAWFVNSLVAASYCQQHSPKKSYASPAKILTRPSISRELRSAFAIGNTPRRTHSRAGYSTKPHTKEELIALVDEYNGTSFANLNDPLKSPNYFNSQVPGSSFIKVSDEEEDEWPPLRYEWPADSDTKVKLHDLEEALKDFSRDSVEIYQLYRALPRPRAPYLPPKTRHKLLRHLSVVEKKDEQSMLRYLSIVDDLKETSIPLNTAEWTSAISFAARYVGTSTAVEVEAALHMWREMEHIAGVKGNEATFNVLFDVACKAGKFTLAEMIYGEMEARGFAYNRYHHVSLIQFYGLKGDGDGARAAYRDLVEAGEIVDTVVLNAMVSALINAREANAAENIYERMKRMHFENPELRLPPRDYKERRQINYVLMKMAIGLKKDPTRRAKAQRRSIVAPDVQTYRILVNYFAVRVGDLEKTAKFLDEMKWFNVPLSGAIFLALLKGFANHGGIRYTSWTRKRLESVWGSFMQAILDDTEDLYISKWMVTWALRAFAKCAGKSRTLEVWEEVKTKWHPDEVELDFVMNTLRPLLEQADSIQRQPDWLLAP